MRRGLKRVRCFSLEAQRRLIFWRTLSLALAEKYLSVPEKTRLSVQIICEARVTSHYVVASTNKELG